jgi:hypothetical protein
MNGKGSVLRAAIMAAMLVVPGCYEDAYEVTTIVNPDGSCERIITCTREKQNLPHSAFPLPVGGAWDTSWTTEKKGSNTYYTYTARRRFASYDSLNAEFSRQRDPGSFRITLEVERHFRWFYTYYTYRERYERFNPFFILSPTAVMTEEEVHRYVTEANPDSVLRKKWDAWHEMNQKEFLFSRLRSGLSERSDTLLSPAELDAHREEIMRAVENDTSHAGTESKEDFLHGAAAQVVRGLVEVFKNPALSRLQDTMEGVMLQYATADSIFGSGKGVYATSAVMPGTLLETNATSVEGNKASWVFSRDQLAMADVVMTVESRTTNFWTLVVTAILVLGIIAGPSLTRTIRRGKRGS